ncbi:MAG: hypothetical protein ABSA74_04350 [Candidatus Staskawiczbacteria bacterium]|jgi:Zn finger protein HypA/HybF involved in hydrogenase expression
MKVKYATIKNQEASNQCSLCAAKFEIWLNNSRLSDEKKEKISELMLYYCPVCERAGDK